MLKDMGKSKPKKKSIESERCKKCKVKIDLDEARELGYVEKLAGKTIIVCPTCGHEDTY